MAEVEVPAWLKSLPLAPEYHPTEAEFLDPIDYIFKIEQQAAQFGICKIVPPYLKAPKRVVFNNLNLSLANSQDAIGQATTVGRNMCPARCMGGSVPASVGLEVEAGGKAKFTTRRQQLGWNARKIRAGLPQAVVHKLVWQSGESYTLDQFEAKAKIFSRNRLGSSQEVVPLAVEALFWKAALEKAISIEYANDIPGSAFAEPRKATFHPRFTNHRRRGVLNEAAPFQLFGEKGLGQEEKEKVGLNKEVGISDNEAEAWKSSGDDAAADNVRGIGCKLSNSAWNMRKVARSPGSLLQFVPDEVPGVTSPMVYIGMLFSWFAWHVEDHELHSLNYLHTGAPKTWYAVPGDAASALEEVVRVQGYGGQINVQDSFARLGEKTTVMSPEVLVAAGVPCCRLVQNAGEYVVTFPRAYHLGFSHGFNCGEAANFATPAWLDVAREASVRRAAMNYLPMLSHQQLLYMLAMSLISRSIVDIACEKRSFRLKEKIVGEEVVKSMFVNDVIQQNDLIGKLLDNGVANFLLVKDLEHYVPHSVTNISDWNIPFKTCKQEVRKQDEVVSTGDAFESPPSESPIEIQVLPSSALVSMASEVLFVDHIEDGEPCVLNDTNNTIAREQVCGDDLVTSPLPCDLSTLPCAACGVLCYTGMAIVRPSQHAVTRFRPLHSHASGPGSQRGKSVVNSLSGVLLGKTNKKSADFHMLPKVEVQPLLEPEETTPGVYTDALYEHQTEEPEVCTSDMKECPTTNTDCRNDAPLSSVDNVGVTPTNSAGDAIEVDKQNHEVVSGLWSAVSVDLIDHPNAGGEKCGLKNIELKPIEEGALPSFQLLAAAYDGDSDMDEYDEIEQGNARNVVGTPLPGPAIHTADLSGEASGQLLLRPVRVIGCHSNLVSSSLNSETTSSSPTLKNSEPISESSFIMLSPSGSQTLALKGTSTCSVQLLEEYVKSGLQLDSCKRSSNSSEDSRKTMIGSLNCQPNAKNEDGETTGRDEGKQKSALSFGECVTCSLPHDSFFDSFEEAALKNVDNCTMELEECTEKIVILVSCDENSKVCGLTARESNLKSNEPVEIPCTSLVRANSQLAEGSSVTMDICLIESGVAVDNCGSQAVEYAIKHPNVNRIGELRNMLQVEKSAPNQLQILKGAARPRVLCLEHAVVAQKRLESIGGSTVIIICHSSFPKIEEQAKVIAAEVGANHQWRSVPFKQAGDEEYSVITAAVEAEEECLPGDGDWVDQLGLTIHGQDKSLSNDTDITIINPSSEESGEPGSRAGRFGRKLKEKKSFIIKQWCGKGWRADQLHPLLGGCRYMTAQADNKSAPANLCTFGGVSSLIENERSCKAMRPARSAEYTPDGRVPRGESDIKRSSKKRKILLESAVNISEDELDEENSEVTPSRLGGSHDGSFSQTTIYGSSEDSLWREVPIASTDSFLLPLHLSGASMAAGRGRDNFLSFTPQSLFSPAEEMHFAASQANTSANGYVHYEVNQSCAVGGFFQRGAKLQALQKLCRQLSTPVSIPCTSLTTPIQFACRVQPSHRRISTVDRLKRKPSTEFSWEMKKPKFVEGSEQKIDTFSPSRRECSLGHHGNGEGSVSNLLITKNDYVSIIGEVVIEDLRQDHCTACENGGGLKDYISNNFGTAAGEDTKYNLGEMREQQYDSDLQSVQVCTSKFLGNTDWSPSKGISQRGDYGVEDLQKGNYCSFDKSPQTPSIDPSLISISLHCTESLPQGPNEQTIRQLGLPSVGEASVLRAESVLVPRLGRVRGKRIKSREWKSCIQMPASEQEEKVSRTCHENHTCPYGSNESITLQYTMSPEDCDSGVQADPDFFPYSSCLTSSINSVRRRRVCTLGKPWGAGKKGNGEAEGRANHFNIQQGSETKMRKKSQKASANQRCEDLGGEFWCDMEGCIMAFDSMRDLQLHKKNLCTWKGCGKHFHMHKYLLQHRRVHLDDRPLKCPWKGCTQAFKWAWARTEHIRVHTGERPYRCMVSGCGQTFRFVSDFSRHKRNTGHRPT